LRDLHFTYFQHEQTNQGTLKIKSWENWIKDLNHHEIRGKPSDTSNLNYLDKEKSGPCLILGELLPKKTRKDSNMSAIHALSLDVDDYPMEKIEEVLSRLDQYEFFLYTTHKHGSEVVKHPRIRVIFPLQNPLPNIDFLKYWHALNNMCEGINDPNTKNSSRLNYLPSTFDSKIAFNYHNEGTWLSTEDLDPFINTQTSKTTGYTTDLEPILNKLQRMSNKLSLKPAAQAILDGESWAPPGQRHKVILDITMWLAGKNPTISDELLTELFKPSLDAMEKPPNIKEILDAYHGAVEKLIQKNNGSPYVYDHDILQEIADRQNCSIKELNNRWIIQAGGGGWILKENGNYTTLLSYRDIDVGIKIHLSKAPVELFTLTSTGTKQKSLSEIVHQYGDLSERNIADMRAQNSQFDPKQSTMIEAVCPIRDELKPVYTPEIDTWLKYLTGNQYEKVIDWMSVCPDLDKLLCAIYFNAGKGSGKNLFAYGLARLWTTGQPADLEQVLSNFNESLSKCPLIYADEEVPKKYQRDSITTKLRSMLSIKSRDLTRKFKAPAELQGAIRLVMGANNEFLLDSNDVSTRADLEAVAERFLYIEVKDYKAANYLKELGRDVVTPWWTHKLAEHALWLHDNHEIRNPGQRFFVEGEISQMSHILMTGSFWNNMVCEWLVRYLMQPTKFDAKGSGLVRIERGELLVNAQGVMDGWEDYMKASYVPVVSKVGAALRAMSKASKQLRWNTRKIWYKIIDVSFLYSWVRQYNIGDIDHIEAILKGDIEKQNVIMFDDIKKEEGNEGY
jgi:hypothetical protein